MLKTPCENVNWKVLSSIRRQLVVELVELGMSRKEIGMIFDITDAAISHYVKNRRGLTFEINPHLSEVIKNVASEIYLNPKGCQKRALLGLCTICEAFKHDSSYHYLGFSEHRCVFDYKRLTDILDENKLKLQTVVNNAPLILFALDPEGKITFIEGRALETLHIEPKMVTGKSILSINEFLPVNREKVCHSLAGEVARSITYFKNRYFETQLTPHFNENKKFIGVIGISIDVTEQKIAEEELKSRIEFEKLITELSTQFITYRPEEIDNEINNALKKIGLFTKVDRSYVFLFNEDLSLVDNTYEWCAQGIEPQIDKLKQLPSSMFPWWMSQLKKFKTVHIPLISHLPPNAEKEKIFLEEQDIKSLIVVPMIHNNKLKGFLGFDSVKKEKTWSKETIYLLKLVSDLFISSLEHKRITSELEEREEQYRLLVENAGVAIVSISRDGTFLFANQKAAKYSFDTPEQCIGKNFRDVLPEEDVEKYDFMLETLIKTKQTVSIKETIPVRDKDYCFNIIVKPVFKNDGSFSHFLVVANDISILMECEARFEETVEMLPVIVCETDIKGNIQYVNKIGLTSFGYSEEDFKNGVNVLDTLHADDKNNALERLKCLLSGEQLEPTIYNLITKSGEKKQFQVSSIPIKKENEIVGIRVVLTPMDL